MILPCMIAFHSFAIQTSVVHYPKLGYRSYDTKDTSVNVPWIWPVSTGECWHNNHHGDPGNPNFGHKHWWELDPTYWLIKLIRKS
jgi:stearoyl-CoA desaturase (delta-9 desaturase)